MLESEVFLNALAEGMPDGERLILCGFPGDPATATPEAWRPRPWRPGREEAMEEHWNGYVTVASFSRAPDNSFRRRKETFAAGRALMVDDVGTKVAPEIVRPMPPSFRVETSPGNEQWWYFLSEPERSFERFDGLIRAFITGRLLGSDPGMNGVTRVGRVPGYVNGKPVNKGWRVVTREARPERRYTVEELLRGFDLRINGRRVQREQLRSDEAIERNRAFAAHFKFLLQRGMLKRTEPDPSGWVEMTCPWVGDHTGAIDNGAALREPAEENDYYGAFKCYHGHCFDRGWSDLTEWIAEAAAEELEGAAR